MYSSTILMCEPSFFSVDYEINPWMKGQIHKTKIEKAKQQWEHLVSIIERYAKVTLIAPQQGLPDMVFTANGALVHKNKALVAKFQPKERQGEERFFRNWFLEKGYEVHATEEPFEGAGDALFDRGMERLWAAYGFRSSIAAHQKIQEILDIEVLSVELVDPRFYHLDTCFCPLNGGYVMYYPGAFSVASQKLIRKHVPTDKLIQVGLDDAQNFALNAINVDHHVIMHKASSRLRQSLEDSGFIVTEANVDEFLKAGGATKCLTLRLDEH